MAAKSSSRNRARIDLVGVHTNEGPNEAGDEGRDKGAENLARYLDGVNASYNDIYDDDSFVAYVDTSRASWALRSGNLKSINVCFVGRANWSREEWLRHPHMLAIGARRVREHCIRYQIPMVRLSSADVRAGKRGICGHVNWTEGMQDGTHWDPGPNFPWDVFIDMVNGEDDMTPEDRARAIACEKLLVELHNAVFGSRVLGQAPGLPKREDISDAPKTLPQYGQATHAEVVKFIDYRPDGGPQKDTVLGHAASAHGLLVSLTETVENLAADVADLNSRAA